MPTYTTSCHLRTSVEDLFAFHLDTINLPSVQPPGCTVDRLERPPESCVGAKIKLTIRLLWFFRQHWIVQWVEIVPPAESGGVSARLVDEMVQGPFPQFRQEHIFTREGDGARLTDRVTFWPPFGIIGWLFLPAFYLQLAGMFAWRQSATRRLLEKGSPR